MKRLYYLVIVAALWSCGEEKESVTPNVPKDHTTSTKSIPSGRLAAECEEVTASNGILLDNCEFGLGAPLTRDTEIEGAGNQFNILNLSWFGVQVKGSGNGGLGASDPTENLTAGFGFNYESTNMTASDYNLGKVANIHVDLDEIYLQSTHGTLELRFGPYNYTRMKIDAAGNIIFPYLPTSSTGIPSKALYVDSNGFVKQKP